LLADRIVQRRLKIARRVALLAAALLLTACADDEGGRVAATTLMGGALGIPAGPIGIAVGAGAGAVAGATVPKEVFGGSSGNDRH
jgi:hypothetical protein